MNAIPIKYYTEYQLNELEADFHLIGRKIIKVRGEYMDADGVYLGDDTCSVDASLFLFFEDGDRCLVWGGRDSFAIELNGDESFDEEWVEDEDDAPLFKAVFEPFCKGRTITDLSMDTSKKTFCIHLDSGDMIEFGQDYDECFVSVLSSDNKVRNLPFDKWRFIMNDQEYVPLLKKDFYLLLRLCRGKDEVEYEMKGEGNKVLYRHTRHILSDEDWKTLDVEYASFKEAFIQYLDKEWLRNDESLGKQYYYRLWYRLPGDTSHRYTQNLVGSTEQYLALKEFLLPIMGTIGIPSETKLKSIEWTSQEKYLQILFEAWKNLDASELIKCLDEDFRYDSFWVFDYLDDDGYKEYIVGKFQTLRSHHAKVQVTLVPDSSFGGQMLKLVQGNDVAYLRIKCSESGIYKMDLCAF